MVFKFFAKLLNERHGRHGRGITQRAKCTPQHVLRKVVHVVDVLFQPAARVEARQSLLQPVGTLATRNAPAAAFMLVKLDRPQGKLDHASSLVEHYNATRAQHRARFHHGIKVHGDVDLVRT